MGSKDKKTNRILYIYNSLIKNEILNKKELANIYNVNEKTIQRDIEDIRCYFSENIITYGENNICYDKVKKGYVLEKKDEELNMKSILVLIKILLESRAFCKDEMNILTKGLLSIASISQKKHITEIIGNEKVNYVPVSHNQPLICKIWDLSDSIRHKKVINITYKKNDGTEQNREVKPVSIIFSEYYFYLIAYIEDFKTATIFRIDRIIKYKEKNERFKLENSKKIEDGEFRKKTQFMYAGKLQRVKFEYYGNSLEAVMDRLPTAKVICEDDEKKTIKAEVYGKGIIMWILSQGKNIKVLEPEELVEDIKKEIFRMQDMYMG